MLSFSRKSEGCFIPCRLPDLMDSTIEIASSDYDLKKKHDFQKIEIIREYEADLLLVVCDANKIQQVFLNIIKNGAEAMADKSRGDLSAERIEERTPRFILRIKREDEKVRIEIEDNGPGMDESSRKRIFEPFFTTKSVGSGTGLGLSVSYFIIKENHQGEMSVESVPGEGAKFIIRLPAERRVG